MIEQWRDIDGFPLYEVSNTGQVRRKAQVLRPGAIPTGHLTVGLCKGSGKPKSMYVHRLVALAFLENPDGKRVVNHKNGKPSDNRLDNLEWSTYSENIRHGYRSNGRRVPTEVRVVAVNLDGEMVMSFRSMADAAKLMGVTNHAIRSAVQRRGTCKGYYWIRHDTSN